MKIVQVPMQEQEAAELTARATALGISRADFIRRACREYVDGLQRDQLDRQYEEAYLAVPEETALSSAGATLAALILPVEDWSG